ESFRARGDLRGAASALNGLGDVAAAQGEYAVARQVYEESLKLFRHLDDRWGIVLVLMDLGNMTHERKDFEAAWKFYVQSLEVCVCLGHRSSVARLMVALAKCAVSQSRMTRALKLAAGAAALLQRVGTVASPDQDAIRKISDQARIQVS